MTGIEEGAADVTAHHSAPAATATRTTYRLGSFVALSIAGLTVVTFALALTAIPNDVPYPFTAEVIADQWPGDYLWMYPAMLLMLLFVALIAAIHQWAPQTGKLFSLLALCLAVISAAVILIDYFVQVTVMQPSLEKGQLDGWAILTQYNPNGVFIALEELGYLLMSCALFCLAPVFAGRDRVERSLRWLFTLGFAGSVAALVAVSAVRGIDRGDVFEIIVISIVWLTLIVSGPLVAIVFRRSLAGTPRAQP